MSRRIADRALHLRPYICPSCRHQSSLRRAYHTSQPLLQSNDTPTTTNLLSTLESRGLLSSLAGHPSTLQNLLSIAPGKRRLTFYAGVDPTAPSLHLGHLLPLMVLFWTVAHGHNAISLIGGATARVGDPTGRLVSRVESGEDVVRGNAQRLEGQVRGLWEHATAYARGRGVKEEVLGSRTVLSNAEWLDKLNLLDFLKTLGNGMRMGTMLGRDTVRNKMEKGDGMSFAEFTYPLLQAWDWWHMYSSMDVQVQVGGSDQYGNIVAGMDAVQYIAQNSPQKGWLDADGRMREDRAPMGITTPLLTTSGGEKFGKSAGNAVWLDQGMTSAFDLYGFLLRTADADVERYLKLFTFVPLTGVSEVMQEHMSDAGKRKAQHLLASEVLTLVHGENVAGETQDKHRASRNPSVQTGGEVAIRLQREEVVGQPWTAVLAGAGLVSSKSEAARVVKSGAVYLATRSAEAGEGAVFQQVKDPRAVVEEELLTEGLLRVRMGKWKVRVIQIVDDAPAVVDEVVQQSA